MSILTMLAKAIGDFFRTLFGGVGSVLGGVIRPFWLTFRSTFKFKEEEVKRPLITLVSILVIAASLVSIYLSQRTPAPKINLLPFQAVGEVTAEETAKLLQDRGEVVILALDTGNSRMPAVSAPIESFQKTLKSHPGITVGVTETVKFSPQSMMGPEMMITADQFFALLEKHSRAAAIVSFVGIPYFKEDQLSQFPERRPKVIAAQAFSPQLRELIDRGIVQVAITPRFQPPQQQGEPKTLREWFDKFYTVVTAENAANLPNFGAPPPPAK